MKSAVLNLAREDTYRKAYLKINGQGLKINDKSYTTIQKHIYDQKVKCITPENPHQPKSLDQRMRTMKKSGESGDQPPSERKF